MDLHAAWAFAHGSFSLMAVAAATVSWWMWRHGPHLTPIPLLPASIGALALHYACMAVDALLHARGPSTLQTTPWRAFGQVALLLAGGLFIGFVLVMMRRWAAPRRLPRGATSAVVLCSAAGVALMVWFGIELAIAVATGADRDRLGRGITRITGSLGDVLTTLALVAPFGFLGALFEQLSPPTRVRARRPSTTHREDATGDASPYTGALLPTPGIRRLSWTFLWVAWMMSSPSFGGSAEPPTGWSVIATTSIRLTLLPMLLVFVYYHTPFLFLDVVIKRGAVWTGVAVVVTAAGVALQQTLAPASGAAVVSAGCVAATLVLCISGTLVGRVEVWLDRVLFGRPNYCEALAAVTTAMARCPTREVLTTTVETGLAQALHAVFVRFNLKQGVAGSQTVPVPSRRGGHFTLGPRRHGQPYGSEDVTFAQAAAAHFGAHLEAFDARQAEQSAAVAELRALRAQINPHFLFNALTLLAEMAQGDRKTERTILNLSQVFRYALTSTQHDRLPLAAELEAIAAYLDIQVERFEGRLQTQIAVTPPAERTPVPPMLLQPLVENAVTHGLASRACGGTLRILASRCEHTLELVVEDDGVGYDVARGAEGVGLANVRARVEQLGGTCHITSAVGKGTRATVTLPVIACAS